MKLKELFCISENINVDEYIEFREYVKENTQDGADITISSPIFTIYAFEELRKVLEKSDKFKFLFNEPTFIKRIIDNDK